MDSPNGNSYNHMNHRWVNAVNDANKRRANFAQESGKTAALTNLDEVGGYRGFGAFQLTRLKSVSGINNNVVGA